MINLIRYFFHILYIKSILIYYGVFFPFNQILIFRIILIPFQTISNIIHFRKTQGERIKLALIKLGPLFIKLGQIISTRVDIFPPAITKELANLLDNLPEIPFIKIKRIIEKELKGNIKDIFLSFDENAFASASIAQVHKAKLHNGQTVAVKIIKPKIKKSIKRDIKLLHFVAKIVNCFKQCKRLRIIESVDLLEKTTLRELDLRFEAAYASKLKENLSSTNFIKIPEIFWEYNSKNILVSEWIEGIPIHNQQKLKQQNYNLESIANKLTKTYFLQVYRDGFFHADMHPGNILITKDEKIALIDFGIMGRLSTEDRIAVSKIIYGFIKRDYLYVAKTHFEAGYISRHIEIEDFALACRLIGEPLAGLPANQISIAKMLLLLFSVTKEYGMETSPKLLLLQKTMLTIEVIASNLHPEINFWNVLDKEFKQWKITNLGAEAKLKNSLLTGIAVTKTLPEIISNFHNILQEIKQHGLVLSDKSISLLNPKSKNCTKQNILLFIYTIITFGGGIITSYIFFT